MHLFRVEDEIVREHWAVRDDLWLFRQLGLVPASPVSDLSASGMAIAS
jgi:hypothetical protein